MAIHLSHIRKKFGNFVALDDVSLEIKDGELIALLGPSGSGKTTLLRIIAGLEAADSGEVLMDGERTGDKHVRERNVGFVFQHYALFKHMTVFDNVAFGLRVRPPHLRPSDYQIRRQVMELLQLVHLAAFYDRYPSQLSGGQRQRVALARALAVKPKVLLLDEPFGALDAKVRKELRRWMRRLHEEMPVTSVFVTHDQEEAMEVADRVVVMSNGKIEQVGTPDEVWNHPVNGFVYDFLGNYNEFEGWKEEDGTVHITEYDVSEAPAKAPATQSETRWWQRYPKAVQLMQHMLPGILPEIDESALFIPRNVKPVLGKGKPVKLYTRPHEMFVTKVKDDKEYTVAKVVHLNPAGSLVKMELERNNGALLQVEVPKSVIDAQQIVKGDTLFIRPKEVKVFE